VQNTTVKGMTVAATVKLTQASSSRLGEVSSGLLAQMAAQAARSR